MIDLANHILLAIAVIFVIEGLIYALFPGHIQKIMLMASDMPTEKFRYFGAPMISVAMLYASILLRLPSLFSSNSYMKYAVYFV